MFVARQQAAITIAMNQEAALPIAIPAILANNSESGVACRSDAYLAPTSVKPA